MFQTLLFTIIFLTGLTVGSFLNCVIYRLANGESFLKGRSFCPHCRQKLSWIDLIPVLSFLILKGKCRYCHKKISWQYPLVEITTGFLFVAIYNLQSTIFTPHFFYLLVTSCFLIIIFVYDLKHCLIPDKVIFPAIGIAFVYRIFEILKTGLNNNLDFSPLIYALFSAGLASFFFLLIFLISNGKWLGFGDVKLVFFLGLILSWPNILTGLFFSFLFGALIGTGLIILKKKTLKSEVPFAPFLVAGTLFTFLWGGNFINWYLKLIL